MRRLRLAGAARRNPTRAQKAERRGCVLRCSSGCLRVSTRAGVSSVRVLRADRESSVDHPQSQSAQDQERPKGEDRPLTSVAGTAGAMGRRAGGSKDREPYRGRRAKPQLHTKSTTAGGRLSSVAHVPALRQVDADGSRMGATFSTARAGARVARVVPADATQRRIDRPGSMRRTQYQPAIYQAMVVGGATKAIRWTSESTGSRETGSVRNVTQRRYRATAATAGPASLGVMDIQPLQLGHATEDVELNRDGCHMVRQSATRDTCGRAPQWTDVRL